MCKCCGGDTTEVWCDQCWVCADLPNNAKHCAAGIWDERGGK